MRPRWCASVTSWTGPRATPLRSTTRCRACWHGAASAFPSATRPTPCASWRLPRRPSPGKTARPLAARMGVDLNLYRGARLVASSRPRLVREGLIDERLPVGVYRMLYLQGERFAATREKIGSFPYTAGFRVLTDARGQPCYVLSAPTLSEQERIAEEQSRTVASLFGSLLVLIAAGDGDGAGPGRRPHAPAAPPAQRARSRRQGRVCPPPAHRHARRNRRAGRDLQRNARPAGREPPQARPALRSAGRSCSGCGRCSRRDGGTKRPAGSARRFLCTARFLRTVRFLRTAFLPGSQDRSGSVQGPLRCN